MSSHNPAQRTSAPADSHPVAGSSAGLEIDHDIDISLANGGTMSLLMIFSLFLMIIMAKVS